MAAQTHAQTHAFAQQAQTLALAWLDHDPSTRLPSVRTRYRIPHVVRDDAGRVQTLNDIAGSTLPLKSESAFPIRTRDPAGVQRRHRR